jgi:integrase
MYFLNRKMRRVLKVKRGGETLVSGYTSVQRLIDYLWLRKSGSMMSIFHHCWHLFKFCSWAKMDPDEAIGKSREELEALLQDYLDEVRGRSMKRGASAKTVNTTLACLKTFFRLNGFSRENGLELRLQGYHQPPRTRNNAQCVPKLGEACLMGERAGSRRNRAIIYTLLSTGLRNTALRAIYVKDVIKEIEGGYQNLLIKVEPEWNKRIPGACKNGIPYYTFTSAQATQAIKEMLEERKEKCGSIKEEEPLFISEGTQLKKRSPLSDNGLREIVRRAAREARIEDWKHVTPHSLRKVFESVLRSPMKDGNRMDPKDQEFLMGHILPGPQEAYYDWTKKNKLREESSKLVFEEGNSPELNSLNMYREMAKILGLNPGEVKKKKEEELGRQLRPKEEKELLETHIKSRLVHSQDDQAEQKIVPKKELQYYMDKGWKFLSVLDEQFVIMIKPTANKVDVLASLANGEMVEGEKPREQG